MLLAAISSLALAAVGLALRPRGWLKWSFALGMVGFTTESLAGYVLLTATELPGERLLWVRLVQAAGVVLPIPWAFFVAALISPKEARVSLGWRFGLAGGSGLLLLASAVVASFQAFQISDTPGAFSAARLDVVGHWGVIVQLLATVGILAALEACLRTAKHDTRWRIKHLVLGLGGVFLVRFYLLSHALLFDTVMASYLTIGAATLFVGNLVIGASLARGRLLGVELTVSRHILYRSVVVGVLGFYLFVVGALGWLLNRLGIPGDLFWGSLAVFVSALGLAALLLSDDVRWRVKRFIGLNFYRSKYDYRQQWITFTKRLGSLLTVEDLAPQLLGAVTEALGTANGGLYLADGRNGRYHLAGAVWVSDLPPTLRPDSPLVTRLRVERTPLLCGKGGASASGAWRDPDLAAFGDGAVAVPLHWRGALAGLMVVGPERTGAPYSPEDFEFLTTVGEQAVGAIMTARLSETLAQTREFEAFHRLTSFVIHDLKNSISALSMLSQNALAHFDDPEFQRDSIKTLSRTVDRMKALLAKLSTAPHLSPLRFQSVELSALVLEAVSPFAGDTRVHLVKNLAPAVPVRGDPETLLRVIQTIVTNAVQSLDGDGVVTAKTYEDQRWAVLSVTDTGCGIPEEFLRKSLFTPFRSTKKGGWGIGLYQAKGIVEGHGGTIEVASKEGEGTTVWVRLPIESQS
jgi:hypothetical protein